MERSALDLGIVLHEKILLDNPPSSFGNIFHGFFVFFRDIFPAEKGTILADGVDLYLLLVYVSRLRYF
jgi:hypothetical protein